MILCWKPDQESPIHDHPDSQCIMKILQGEVFEDLYTMSEGNEVQAMTQIGEQKTYITDQMIHITGKYRSTHSGTMYKPCIFHAFTDTLSNHTSHQNI